MKRFIALCALFVPFAVQADAHTNMKDNGSDKFTTATNAADETWAERTQISGAFKKTKNPLWTAQTIQPFSRDSAMANTVFGQAEFGFQKWESPLLSVGLGYRHLAACNTYMLGANLFYDHAWRQSMNNVGLGAEMFGNYFTVRLNYNFRVHDHKGHLHTFTHSFGQHNTTGNLDLNFQLPYLPWTVASIGPRWHHNHDKHADSSHHWKFAVRMNIAGPVALETGFDQGWGRGGYVKLAVNFGRPAVVEHSLLDSGIFASQAFTARDLKNYTLEPVGRFGFIR